MVAVTMTRVATSPSTRRRRSVSGAREEVEAREDAEVVTGAEGVASGAPPAELIPRP
ncbi:hypothetical protein ACFPRL_22400 [Pseudoclavibacter helvolus]